MGTLGDPEAVEGEVGAGPQFGQFLQQRGGVNDRARAENVRYVRIEDPGRRQVQREGALVVDDGVPGVVAALEADHHLRMLGEAVDDLALAFVAPLGAEDGDGAHGDCPRRVVTVRSPVVFCMGGIGAVR